MTNDHTRPDRALNHEAPTPVADDATGSMRIGTTLVVTAGTVVISDALVWNDDEYQSVAFASPDRHVQFVLAGHPLTLTRALRSALAAVGPRSRL